MSILMTGNRMERITDALSILTTNVKLHNSRGRTDINADAEDFYCGLLNIVLGKSLQNLNALQMDFPAIDLADRAARLCVQVTSTEGRGKVNHTLEKFYERDMQKDFDRLIILVIGEKDTFKKPFPGKGGFVFDPKEDIWDTPKLLAEIEHLPEAKQKEADEYLQKHLNIPAPKASPLRLPVPERRSPAGFQGRTDELADIRRRMEAREKPVIIAGLGGMGKTMLAAHYARERRGAVLFVRFDTSFTRTLASGVGSRIPQEQRRNLPDEEVAEMALELLAQYGPADLLIVDNAEVPGKSWRELTADPCYSKLRSLPMAVLMTTRSRDTGGLWLGTLKRDELRNIFRGHKVSISEAEMDRLIDAVDGHTMMVDMIARTLRESWTGLTATDILTAMEQSTLHEGSYEKIENDHDPEQGQIYAHLKALFNLAPIPEDGKQALRCATLLPQEGMDPALFLRGLSEGPADAIRLLEKQGWVSRENQLLTIHPVVRLVSRTELKPDEEHCADFLDALWRQFDSKKHERVKFTQLAEVFANAMELGGAPQTKAKWLNSSGRLWGDLMESRRCAALYEAFIPVLEPHLPAHPALATAYNNAGMAYGYLGDHKKALEYKLKALAIQEKVLPQDHPDLAASYNNVGVTYDDLGDHKKALEYMLKALAIREKILPLEHPDLATSYNNVGSTYGHLGDHKKALEYMLKALDIWEKVLPPEHPSLATSYNNMGSTYGDLGDHQKALEYKLKALAICEQVLPPEHPDLATTYNNVGYTYGALGDHARALEYKLKALAIREKVLLPDHPDLAASYNNVGHTYGALGDYKKALEYNLKSLAIREKVLPPEHPDLAQSYNNVGYSYGKLGDREQELEYQLKALAIRKKVLPPTHPALALSCNNLACTYYEMGQRETALKYMRRAADIAEQSLPEGHPDRVDYRRWAEEIEREVKIPKWLRWLLGKR